MDSFGIAITSKNSFIAFSNRNQRKLQKLTAFSKEFETFWRSNMQNTNWANSDNFNDAQVAKIEKIEFE